MAMYSVHVRRKGIDPDHDIVVIKEGFNWQALFFSFLWALWYKLWALGGAIVLVLGGTGYLAAQNNIAPELTFIAHAGFAVIIGYIANDAWRYDLGLAGFETMEMVEAGKKIDAERIFYQRHPELAASVAQGLND